MQIIIFDGIIYCGCLYLLLEKHLEHLSVGISVGVGVELDLLTLEQLFEWLVLLLVLGLSVIGLSHGIFVGVIIGLFEGLLGST